MRRVRTFSVRSAARRFRRAVRQALSLPRTATRADLKSGRVVQHGGGRHVPLRKVVTTDHGHVLRRPSGGQWAYPVDAELRALEGRKERIGDTDVTISAIGERDVETGGETPWTKDDA